MVFHGKAAPAPSAGLCSEDLEAKPFSHRATEREWVLCDQHFFCDAFFFFPGGWSSWAPLSSGWNEALSLGDLWCLSGALGTGST